MNPVQILTVKNKIPLFKGQEAANAIELIQLEEVGFEIVSQKDLYKVGEKAVYVQPDYCLSEISLFESFIRPNGDSSKCKLGSKNRIRAIKFNFHRGDNQVVYSQGILLPWNEVQNYLASLKKGYSLTNEELNLSEVLGITKWEDPYEKTGSGLVNGASSKFPDGMYRTDEENVNNVWDHLFHKIIYPVQLVGSEKIDGSSITLWCKNGKSGICSRNLSKPLFSIKIVGRREKNLLEKLLFWTKPDLNIYKEVESDSDFVIIGKPYLDKLVEYCRKTNQNLALRGELNGSGARGSGNKNNPSAILPMNIQFYGVDLFDNTTIKLGEESFDKVVKDLDLNRCKVVFNRVFNSKEEILQECNNYFKTNLIEGIVIRTLDSSFSAKVMNLEYDAKK